MRTIGLMSGTSLDGVDAAVVETDGETVQGFGPRLTLPYPAPLRPGAGWWPAAGGGTRR